MEYKVGDIVIIHRKFVVDGDLIWSGVMDNFIGCRGKIVDKHMYGYRVKFEATDVFNEKHSYSFKSESFRSYREEKLERILKKIG